MVSIFRITILLITGWFFGVNSSVLACELKFGWEPWPPFQYQDSNKVLTGLDIDLLNIVTQRMNCSTEFLRIRWIAHLERLKDGSLDLAASASWSKERASYVHFSEPYRKEEVGFFIRKEDVGKYNFKGLKDIAGSSFVLGATLGYYYGEEFEELLKKKSFKNNIELVEDNLNNFKKLAAKRIDGFLMDKIPAFNLMGQVNPSLQIAIHPMEIYSCDIHVLFSKNSVPLKTVHKFNEVLRQIKQEGVYDKILNKYLNTN